jgi:hypothetical protein
MLGALPPPKKEWALAKRGWRVFSAPVYCGLGVYRWQPFQNAKMKRTLDLRAFENSDYPDIAQSALAKLSGDAPANNMKRTWLL